jgi:hypothetical protein
VSTKLVNVDELSRFVNGAQTQHQRRLQDRASASRAAREGSSRRARIHRSQPPQDAFLAEDALSASPGVVFVPFDPDAIESARR